jgi:multiple sugar transport system substrate-binding protein
MNRKVSVFYSELRSNIDDLIRKMRAGRIKRRTFLERALALGIRSSVAFSIFEAFGGSTPSTGGKTIHLLWLSENESSLTYQQLVDDFNSQTQDIHVIHQSITRDTTGTTLLERDILQKRNTAIDIISIDIIRVAEFAANRWITPITETQWPTNEQAKYLPGPIQGCTFNGKLWAVPFRTDVGLIYYRTDIVSTPPTSWTDLVNIAQGHKGAAKYGYVLQGALFEGLVCNFQEVLLGYGGTILDPADPTRVTVNSPEAIQALTEMVSWVGTITPTDVVKFYKEDNALTAWKKGNAIFMRNWPRAYADSSNPSQSNIVGKFDIHPMLYDPTQTNVGHSCIGGWQLAINAFISDEKKAAAWEFIKYMLSPRAQKIGAMGASWAVTLRSIYDDPEVLRKVPLFKQLKPVLQTALPRPVTPKYSDVTQAIQTHVHQALERKKSPSDALNELASELTKIVGNP